MCIYSCYVFKKRVPCKHYIEPMCFYNTDVRGRLNQCEGIHWNTHAFKKFIPLSSCNALARYKDTTEKK